MGRIEDTAETPATKKKGLDPFGLAVYGDSLLSRNVRLWIIAFTVALIAQFCVDVWAWYHAWKYGTENAGFAVIGGLVFATAILLFDRSVIIHDTQHNKWSWLTLGGRLVVLFVLAFITAIPVELRIFESEINQRFDNREIALKDDIRERAIKQESEFYGEQVKAEEKAGTTESTRTSTAGNTDLEKYQARRAAERKTVADRYAADKAAMQQKFAADKERVKQSSAADKAAMQQKFAADKERVKQSSAAEKENLNGQIEAIDKKIAEEAGGKYSGIVGIGPIVQSMREEKKNALDNLDKVRESEIAEMDKILSNEAVAMDKLAKDEITAMDKLLTAETETMDKLAKSGSAELTNFDKETSAKVADMQNARDGKTENVKKDRDEKIAALRLALNGKLDAIQAMTGEELSKNYGGEWRVSRGFLDHYRELDKLTDESDANSAIAWGARLTMMALGLIIFFLKIMVSKGVKEYYSQGTQIANGTNPETLELGKAMGYTTPESRAFLGLGIREQRAMMRVLKAQAEVSDAIDNWFQEARRFAIPQQVGNARLCLDRTKVDGKLEELWVTIVNPALAELAEAERELRVPIPKWTTQLAHPDPRGNKEPWRKTDAELARWGWENPRPLVNQAEQARGDHPAVMHKLASTLMHLEQMLISMVGKNPNIDQRKLEQNRFGYFSTNIFPQLLKLEELERAMVAGGMEPPERLDALTSDLKECWKVNSGKLQELGWIGPTAGGVRTSGAPKNVSPSAGSKADKGNPLDESTDEFVAGDAHENATPASKQK